MPPRYAYWTIIVDEQPTAFRAAAQDDLMPTFKRLKEKHPSTKMMWFQNGKLWPSRVDAQEAMRARGDLGRRGDSRQGGGFRDRDQRPTRERSDRGGRPEWTPRDKNVGENFSSPRGERKKPREHGERLDWKPKGEFTPAPKRSEKPEWKPKPSFNREHKSEWKPKGSFDRERKSEWRPKGSFDRGRRSEWKPRGEDDRPSRSQDFKTSRPRAQAKLEWTPKGERPKSQATGAKPHVASPKRQWVPKAEYKKSQGIEVPRDNKWRPGGEHRDPKQKYKDAKKAKWSKFKKTIRTRWETKSKKKS